MSSFYKIDDFNQEQFKLHEKLLVKTSYTLFIKGLQFQKLGTFKSEYNIATCADFNQSSTLSIFNAVSNITLPCFGGHFEKSNRVGFIREYSFILIGEFKGRYIWATDTYQPHKSPLKLLTEKCFKQPLIVTRFPGNIHII